MIKPNTVIGLSGVAGAGKDTFLEILSQQLPNVKRFALADNLKRELNPFFMNMYGVDIFTCPRETKDLLRPILVAHGKMRRLSSQGRHWTEMLQKEILAFQKSNPNSIVVVTDVRYDFYSKDEIHWLKKEMNGIFVHIQRFYEKEIENTWRERGMDFKGKSDFVKTYIEAPNEDEKINDPKMIRAADYRVVWPTLIKPDKSIDYNGLSIYVEEFIKYLQK